MSHIYENDTKPILSDPPYLLQFILAVVLSVLCGATIMFMWNWFVVPLGLPMIGLVQALGLDTLITFIVTTRVNTNPGPFWDRWIIAITYALLTLFSGWLLHLFMYNTMTEQEKLINVDLYGDGSRNSRLRAEYIYCDHADVCSVYKEGKCFRKTTLFGVRCEFGRIACVDGGTKKTKMYGRVYSEAKDSERYHKLSYPNNTYIAKIGDGAFLAPPYVRIERGPDSRLFCHDPGFGCNRLFVPIDELTPDNINRICTYHPRAMLGGEIKSYQTETIPIFLHQLSKLFPEQYSAFIKAFPDYELKAPDYRGKYAKLSTCNRELIYRDAHGNSFRFDGDELVCDKYRIGGFMPFSSSGYAQMRIPVTDDMWVKITDSNQVTDQTVLM